MISDLNYPFDSSNILKKKKSIKKNLLLRDDYIEKKIAILGGSTTSEIKNILELFLLNNGIKPMFYECDFNKYYETIMFDNIDLQLFKPDIIFIHTSSRNIENYPSVKDNEHSVNIKLQSEIIKYKNMWNKIQKTYKCLIIQNNFEMLSYRLLGNKDISDFRGAQNYINRLNVEMYDYAQSNNNFYINDINYLSAWYGLEKWSEPLFWYMYKYALNVDAIPLLCHNVANVIKAIFGKNKKSLVLDLDNTLWGGVIGECGLNGLELGNETAIGQAYIEFQQYIKKLKDIGILINICSKNEYETALSGFNHPDSVLKFEDLISFKANWENKDENILKIAEELNILPESMVFVDDNPAERERVRTSIYGIGIPNLDTIENYIKYIDMSGFFETIHIMEDDIKRNEFYKENKLRYSYINQCTDYLEYLKLLEMKAEIVSFKYIYLERIVQLVNKTNQFNLTTKRYTYNEIENIRNCHNYITLYGKLEDKFGDNGIVSVVIGEIKDNVINIDLWIMSCRVFKRNLEYAMFDNLVKECKKGGIVKIVGNYLKTNKNGLVAEFYGELGFVLLRKNDSEDSVWEYLIPEIYTNKNNVIEVNNNE